MFEFGFSLPALAVAANLGGAIAPVAQADFTTMSAQTMPSWLSFSRAGNATVFDATGKRTYAPNNLLTYSNDLTNAAWSIRNQVTVTGGQPDPLGGATATRVQGTGSTWYIAQSPAAFGRSLLAVWVKSNTGSNQTIRLFYNGGAFSTDFTVSTSWQQIYIVATTTSSSVGIARDVAGDTADILVYAATVSLTTYETTPRAVDQVITTSSAYYGPRFDYDPGTLAAKGLLIEEARTNLLLNSKADGTGLSTQSVTVSAQAYTLSFYGTGTVTLSGASTAGPLTGSGAFPARSTLTFTPTSGTLTLTITGTVQYANLEAGSFATSYIPTTTAAVTRAADAVGIIGNALTTLKSSAATAILEAKYVGSAPTTNPVMLGGGSPSVAYMFMYSNSQVGTFTPSTNLLATLGSGLITSAFRSAIGFDASGRSLVANGGTVATDAVALSTPTGINLGSYYGGIQPASAWYSKFAIYNSRLPDATLQAKSAVGAPF